MSESFSMPSDPSHMRADMYARERARIENVMGEIDEKLDQLFGQEHAGEVADNSINPEVNLLNATKQELQEQLERLRARYEHGR